MRELVLTNNEKLDKNSWSTISNYLIVGEYSVLEMLDISWCSMNDEKMEALIKPIEKKSKGDGI